MAELQAEGAKIHAAVRAMGRSDIQEVGYNPDGSGLRVERMPAEVAQAKTAALAKSGKAALRSADEILSMAKLQVPVEVVTAKAAVKPAIESNRLNDYSPWNGGGRWETWRGSDYRGSCTTGFGVKASGRYWVLSAGHCASLGDTAYQGKSGGSLKQMGPINSDQWQYDLLLIDAPGFRWIFDGSPTTSTKKTVYDWGYWAANELVCQSGMHSGVICGIKQERSVDVTMDLDSDGDCCYTVYGLIRSYQIDGAIAGRGGDSGGPVFTLMGDGVRAKGITSGANGNLFWFQDWHDVIRQFGAYPRTPSN